MDGLFWQRLHGGSTHLPLVLLPVSMLFDFIAFRMREAAARRVLHAAGLALALAAALGGCAAVIAGLAMTHGSFLGSGQERSHHLFVWPAFFASIILVGWRSTAGRRSSRGLRIYLAGMGAASALMLGAGYSGGEMLLRGATGTPAPLSVSPAKEFSSLRQAATGDDSDAMRGHRLFLKNCAHCHGDDARGTDDGPDLTQFRKSDARIASVVKNGIKGEMPRFGQKLADADVAALIRFIRSLDGRDA